MSGLLSHPTRNAPGFAADTIVMELATMTKFGMIDDGNASVHAVAAAIDAAANITFTWIMIRNIDASANFGPLN